MTRILRLLALCACASSLSAQQQAAAGPAPALPLGRLDWRERDLEGRWVAYRADMAANERDSTRKQRWVDALGSRGDHELLEWIAIFEGWGLAGGKLAALDAPQWMRVAVWNLRSLDSHDLGGARKALEQNGPRVRGWFDKYPVLQRGRGASLYEGLRRFEPGDPGDQLPPLDEMQVLMPYLDPGPVLQEFGDRLRAEPGVRYVHQVVRSLRALPVWGEIEPLHARKVFALVRHPHAIIRAEAFAAFTRMPGHVVPWRELEPLTRTGSEADRRLALLAWSYGDHPRVFLELHVRAMDPEEELWEVALSRLRDVGTGFSAAWLQQRLADPAAPSDLRRSLAARGALQAIDKRARSVAADPAWLGRHLERLAWAERAGHVLAADLKDHVERTLRAMPAAERAAWLAALRTGFEPGPGFAAEEAGTVASGVRGWLDRLERTAAGR